MKNLKYTIFALLVFSLVSCDFLDHDESVGRAKDEVYAYFNDVNSLVTNIYSYLPSDWGNINGALLESASDNAVHVWNTSNIYKFYNGSWAVDNMVDNVWPYYYKGIRAANQFLQEFDLEYLERYKYNETFKEEYARAKNYPSEVRFLRAYYYFELIKRYKDVPLETTVVSQEEVNSLKQKSFEEIVEFISSECDEIKNSLPVDYSNLPFAETGRVTKGAVMALKSRVLLYAASPLFNNNIKDSEKYERAAEAAYELIDSSLTRGWYKISKKEIPWGNGNKDLFSSELIFESRGGESNAFERKNFPIGFEGGNTGTCPSQNLVDAFEMADGTPFDWNNPAHKENPYKNRDPRLYQTVLFNGVKWKSQTIETFENGRNGLPLYGATVTGYYLRKNVNQSISLEQGRVTTKPHHYVLFRLSEILLNYAEAMTESLGHDYKDSKYKLSAIDAINMVRSRSGAIEISNTYSKEEFIKKYMNERRIELAFEGHRFWDIRRWGIAEKLSEIYGVRINKINEGFNYERVLVQERVWNDRMYLYPKPNKDTYANHNINQNPGW